MVFSLSLGKLYHFLFPLTQHVIWLPVYSWLSWATEWMPFNLSKVTTGKRHSFRVTSYSHMKHRSGELRLSECLHFTCSTRTRSSHFTSLEQLTASDIVCFSVDYLRSIKKKQKTVSCLLYQCHSSRPLFVLFHFLFRYSVGVFAPHLGALIGVILYDTVISTHLNEEHEGEDDIVNSSRPISTNDREPLVEHIGTFYSSTRTTLQ